MKRILKILLLQVFTVQAVFATHNRAGEITLHQIDEFTYEINITTFTYTYSQADRSKLEVQWGDNTFSSAPRVSKIYLPNAYNRNVYIAQHTFPGAGTYEIVVQDPNRNLGVKNIPNSVNVIFSVKTTITINPSIGHNSTPILLNPPIDRAALNQIFIHNPAAFDPDGDSISYKLTVCTEKDGKPIENYTLPSYSDTLYIDPITGDLTWIRPNEIGIYNIAIDVEEWRSGVKIGNIVRDMQIEVYDTENNSPEIDSLKNYCVIAGEEINFQVIANDEDLDSISLSAAGGPFILENNQAYFQEDNANKRLGHSEAEFRWKTSCSNVRQQFYTIVFKAEDDNPDTKLVDIKNVNIRVIAPPPAKPLIIPSSNSILLNWEVDSCSLVSGYRIYRKAGPSGYVPDSCITGVPSFTGFSLIEEVGNRMDTVFVDDNNGKGLAQGTEYCYMITSIFPDGAESLPSKEVCSPLVAGLPALLETTVLTDDISGKIEIKWAHPSGIDTLDGPFEYKINRYTDYFGNNLAASFSKYTNDKNDTTFIDSTVNTIEFPYSYSVALFQDVAGELLPISDTSRLEFSSTLVPELTGEDNTIRIEMKKNVPWINYDYTIFRLNPNDDTFYEIGYTTENEFLDTGLKNEREYCYRIISTGWRSIDGQYYENSNISHINCGIPEDNTPPCTPILDGQSYCEEQYNYLVWNFLSDTCYEDVEGYNLYFAENETAEPVKIEDFEGNKTDTSFIHIRTNQSLTGCYYLAAVDSFENVSPLSAQFCLDECSNYVLPNVFSPNNDTHNDLYKPYRTAYVEKVDFQVFNRWGLMVFRTSDPDINWDGKILDSEKLVSPGVYYYICEVFEPRLGGIESYTLTGFIYVYSGNKNDVFIE